MGMVRHMRVEATQHHASSHVAAWAAASRGRRAALGVASTSRRACAARAMERDPSLGGGGYAPAPNKDVCVFWPRCFREAASSVNSIQQGHTVVVNVSEIPQLDEQQRAVDFIAGGCYALEGQQDMLAESIFVFYPSAKHQRAASDGEAIGACDLKHSQAARDALISLARSQLREKI